jgi:hypothetical protein
LSLSLLAGCASKPVPAQPMAPVAAGEGSASTETGPSEVPSEEGTWLPEEALEEEPAAEPEPQTPDVKAFRRAEIPDPTAPVKASKKIRAGEYRCKISREYKLRPCTVSVDEHGRTQLEIATGLLGIRGVLTDKGARVHFEGVLTEGRPFGCFSCQERCSIDPDACVCKEHPREASQECLLQPIRFDLAKKQGTSKWMGRFRYKLYYNEYDKGQVVGFTFEEESFMVVLTK